MTHANHPCHCAAVFTCNHFVMGKRRPSEDQKRGNEGQTENIRIMINGHLGKYLSSPVAMCECHVSVRCQHSVSREKYFNLPQPDTWPLLSKCVIFIFDNRLSIKQEIRAS